MQAEINFTFDLGTAAGRSEFQRMFEHLLPAGTRCRSPVRTKSDEGSSGAWSRPSPSRARARAGPASVRPPNLTSIPDDPVRAAAAKAGRQEAAAKARAAKVAKAGIAGGNGQVDNCTDLTGPEDQAVEDDLGLVDPNMTPAEAKEAGLAIVREAYAAGKVAQVKALQKAWGIAKFYDIPIERGHEFYRQVMKLAHETGLRK